MGIDSEVLVIGGGLAGITAAITASREGADVRLVSHKQSTLQQASGLIDALGYVPPTRAETGENPMATPTAGRQPELAAARPKSEGPLPNPFEAIPELPADHPYRIVGADALREGLALFDELLGDAYMGGHTERNALIPTVGGTVKPTARYPAASAAGLASDDRPMLVVGFRSLPEYDARYVADRLEAAGVPFEVAGAEIEFATGFREDAAVTRFANALDRDERLVDERGVEGKQSKNGVPARRALAEAVDPHLTEFLKKLPEGDHDVRVGFPALLGDDHGQEVRAALADQLGADIFEIPMGPPSLPGLRLADQLYDALDDAGVRFETGVPVVGCEIGESPETGPARVEAALVDRKGREIAYTADQYVLATGGLVGKGIDSDREGVREPIFDCHVPHPRDRYEWFVDDAFGDQPYARFGVYGDEGLRPLGPDGEVQFENVHAVGATLGGADVAREKSASGVSLATGLTAGRAAANEVTND